MWPRGRPSKSKTGKQLVTLLVALGRAVIMAYGSYQEEIYNTLGFQTISEEVKIWSSKVTAYIFSVVASLSPWVFKSASPNLWPVLIKRQKDKMSLANGKTRLVFVALASKHHGLCPQSYPITPSDCPAQHTDDDWVANLGRDPRDWGQSRRLGREDSLRKTEINC